MSAPSRDGSRPSPSAGPSRILVAVACGLAVGLLPCAIQSAPSAVRWAPRAASVVAQPPGELRTPVAPALAAETPVDRDRVSAVAARAGRSVVAIDVEARLESEDVPLPLQWLFPELPEGQIVTGGASGFVIDPDGLIMTNLHVVERATRIRVRLADRRELPATVVATDQDTDLAVIRVAARELEPLRFADMDAQRPGQTIVALGAPFGLETTVTTGVLSAIGRGGLGLNEIEDYVQTDASVHPGSSGGPLVNLDGEVVGVTTVIVGPAPGLSFGVSAEIAREVARQVVGGGRVRRAWIGADVQELTAELDEALGLPTERRGALVNAIEPRSPAARAGIAAGDAIVAVDGAPLQGSVDFTRRLLRRTAGDPVELAILRDGEPRTISLRTTERPRGELERDAERGRQAARETDPGIEVVPLTQELARQLEHRGTIGAVVARVRDGGPADRAGLHPGDVIVEVERRTVRRPEDVRRALADGSALVRIEREDRAYYTVIGHP